MACGELPSLVWGVLYSCDMLGMGESLEIGLLKAKQRSAVMTTLLQQAKQKVSSMFPYMFCSDHFITSHWMMSLDLCFTWALDFLTLMSYHTSNT